MGNEMEKLLRSLETPLLFASRNNFSNLEKVPELGEDVRKISTRLLTGKSPEPIKTRITALRNSFSDFKGLTRSEKTERISSALTVIRGIRSASVLSSEPGVRTRSHTPRPGKKLSPKKRGEGLLASVADIPGLGAKVAGLLEKRSVRTVYDLLFYCPRKYDDRREITQMCELLPDGETPSGAALFLWGI